HDSDSKPSPFLLNGRKNPSILVTDPPSNNYIGVPDALFETGRKGADQLQYSFPHQGPAEVVLYFSPPQNKEEEHAVQILVEGEIAAPRIDVEGEAGTDAMKKTYGVTIKDESLDITIKTMSGSPILSGIEVCTPGMVTGIRDQKKALVEV